MQFAFILAGVAVGTLVVKGTWLPLSAILAAAAGYVLSLVVIRLVRILRGGRERNDREGERQAALKSPAASDKSPSSTGMIADLILQDAGPRKISVIKAIAENGNLGIGEAKELADQAPCAVLTGVSGEVAAAAAHLRSIGAEVLVRPSAKPS